MMCIHLLSGKVMNCQSAPGTGMDVVRQRATHRSQVPILGCQPVHKGTMVTSCVF